MLRFKEIEEKEAEEGDLLRYETDSDASDEDSCVEEVNETVAGKKGKRYPWNAERVLNYLRRDKRVNNLLIPQDATSDYF